MTMLYNEEIQQGDKVWWYTLYARTYQIHSGIVQEVYYSDDTDTYPDTVITNQPINESQEFYGSRADTIAALREYYLNQFNTAEKNLNLLNRDDSDDV